MPDQRRTSKEVDIEHFKEPLKDSLEYTVVKETGNQHLFIDKQTYKKSLIIILLIGFIIGIGIILFYVYKNRSLQISEETGDEKSGTAEESDIRSIPSDNSDSYGIDDSPVQQVQPKYIVPADTYKKTEKEIEKNEKTESDEPQIRLTGPVVSENADDVKYTYTLEYNKEAKELYQPSISYVISAEKCNINESFINGNDFKDNYVKLTEDRTSFSVSIKDLYLLSNSGLEDSTYLIKDNSGNVIGSGAIRIPPCKTANESNRYGEFSIDGPELDKNLVNDMYHFQYSYNMDSDARKLLEKGFELKFKHDCEDWVINELKGDWGGEWDDGEMDDIGYAVNVDEDAFNGLDEDELYETSAYKVYDHDGKEVFSGFVKVPNCR